MAVVRAPRPESGYYVLDKKISGDVRLSWAARGLLVFLLGKPDDWTVSVANLVNETRGAEKVRRTGRDGVYSLLNELISAGYVKRVQKNDGGKFGDVDYLVSETCEPLPAKPDTAEPLPAAPDTANPTLPINEVTKGKKEPKGSGGSELPKTPRTPGVPSDAGASGPKADSDSLQELCRKIWDSYKEAFLARYAIKPLRTAKENSLIRSLARALPAAEAPEIARFYVGMNVPFYLQKTHDIGVLVKDVVSVRTRWAAAQAGVAIPSGGDAQPRGVAPAFDPLNKDTWGRDSRGRFNGAQYVRDEIRATQMLATGAAQRGDVIDAQAREVRRGG